MKQRVIKAVAFAAALCAGPALANDTMAELKTGGLAFVRSDAVTMVEEELYISPTRVTVDYVFRNTSDKDVTSYIAFPMPDLQGTYDSPVALDDTEADNFLGFTVAQDGQPIKTQLQQRVIVSGIDMTDEVASKGIPLLPMSDRTFAAVKELPPEVLDDWAARGLIYDEVYDQGNGMEHNPTPIWTLRSAYWWKTTFPAARDVRVHHEYRPSVGGTAGISFAGGEFAGEEWYEKTIADYRSRYCLDASFERLAEKLTKAMNAGTGPYYTEQWISYVLQTGANWYGPIERFRLTVDKGAPENYVSFCGSNVKKTGPTTFEFTAEDFEPLGNIDILLLVRNQ